MTSNIHKGSPLDFLLKRDMPPVALILAGYNKFDPETRKKRYRELMEAYEGDVIYMGENKFLRPLGGKPVIQYVIDAVYNARKDGNRLYDKIYVYNDKKMFEEMIDISRYDNLYINQMKDSVGGHWKDFYNNYVDYGQRIDIFFGDTPRITSEDVEYLHGEYEKIIGIQKDYRGVPISVVVNIVEFEDLHATWLPHRIKYIKVGKNKGKLKNFVGFDAFQARIGNSGAMIKDPCLDDYMNYEVVNFGYNLRKALTPSILAKIMYYLWRSKRFDMIRQIKNKCLNETVFFSTAYDVISNVYKIDMSKTAGVLYHIKKNGAHWENDIDGPKDYEAFQKALEKTTHRNR